VRIFVIPYQPGKMVMLPRSGVLLVNLGTPNSPHPRDVYRYLIEFLTDGRVIDLPWWKRNLLVRSVIVPRRYKQSAECYRKIWMAEGSPLLVYGLKVKELLQKKLGGTFKVELGMRYQSPSITSALSSLTKDHLEEVIILPLFPQYACATTGSIHQKIMEELKKKLFIPKIIFINNYAADPGLIAAFAAVGSRFAIPSYDHILFSFHGLPQKHLKDLARENYCLQKDNKCCSTLCTQNHFCYSAQCFATARLIAKSLNIPEPKYSISFQSILGKDPWLMPYTNERIKQLAQNGLSKILVFCPSFVCDCLETIYEIGMEYTHEFKYHGGATLDLVPGLNEHPKWIEAMEKLILGSTQLKTIP
jgi:ferrochelatase